MKEEDQPKADRRGSRGKDKEPADKANRLGIVVIALSTEEEKKELKPEERPEDRADAPARRATCRKGDVILRPWSHKGTVHRDQDRSSSSIKLLGEDRDRHHCDLTDQPRRQYGVPERTGQRQRTGRLCTSFCTAGRTATCCDDMTRPWPDCSRNSASRSGRRRRRAIPALEERYDVLVPVLTANGARSATTSWTCAKLVAALAGDGETC